MLALILLAALGSLDATAIDESQALANRLTELEARRVRVEAEAREIGELFAETLSLKLTMSRLLNDPTELEEKGLGREPIVASRVDDGGVALDVHPVYFSRCPVKVIVQEIARGRHLITVRYLQPDGAGKTREVPIELERDRRRALVDNKAYGALEDRPFRLILPTRVQLFIQWREDSAAEIVVVNGYARHLVRLGNSIEEHAVVTERAGVPSPALIHEHWGHRYLPSLFGSPRPRLISMDGLAVAIPLGDGSVLVRSAAEAFVDDPRLDPTDRAELAGMRAWGGNAFSARGLDQLRFLEALQALEVADAAVSVIDRRDSPDQIVPELKRRAEAADRVAELSAVLISQAAPALEKSAALRREVAEIQAETARLLQRVRLVRTGEIDRLFNEFQPK